MAILSKRACKYIVENLSNFVSNSEIITYPEVDIETHHKSLKKVKKMLKNFEQNPEKYLDPDISDEEIERIEEEAEAYERRKGY